MIAVKTKPIVRVESTVQRRPDGSYQAGACFDRGSWVWVKLQARRSDKAKEQAPEAIARLMVNHAEVLEEQARALATKAGFLRDCARVKVAL